MSDAAAAPRLSLTALPLRFTLRFAEPVEPWDFIGATIRGGLGIMLKRFVCVRRGGRCDACMLRLTCHYRRLFEPVAPSGAALPFAGMRDLPRPFVLDVVGITPGAATSDIDFGLVLVGDAAAQAHYFVQAFVELGERGLARERRRFTVAAVRAGDAVIYDAARPALQPPPPAAPLVAAALPNGPVAARLTFLTPMRIKADGKYSWDGSFAPLFRSLLRRVTLLETLYCGGSPERDVPGLLAAADAVALTAGERQWQERSRTSQRSKLRTFHGGYTGTAEYANLTPQLVAMLHAGEAIHAGHNATFGLGAYRVMLLPEMNREQSRPPD